MTEAIGFLSAILSIALAIWLGTLYFDGDFGECFTAALTPWLISMLLGSFWDDFGKAIKFDIFLIGVSVLAFAIFSGLDFVCAWCQNTVIPLFG